MKIAVNTRFLLKGKLEGIGRFTLEVLKKIAADHPEHDFYFFFDRPYDESFIFEKNITPVVLFPPARHPVLFYLWFEWSVSRALKKYQIDVFLSTDNFCSLSTRVPTVLVVHDVAYLHFPEQVSFTQRKYYRFFTPRFLRKASKIVAVSNYTKKDIVENFGTDFSKVSVACNGCDPIFQPISKEEKIKIQKQFSGESPYFVYVGAIHPRKNVANMIRAFDAFKKKTGSDVKFVIIGRKGWMNEDVQSALRETEFENEILFTGYVEHSILPKIIAGAMAMVYVSLFEGFGIPILEAMHCDIPVITSTRSSMPEVGGDAVLYADPDSFEEISRQMIAIFENPDLRQNLILKGRKQRLNFSWEKAAEVVYAAIESAN